MQFAFVTVVQKYLKFVAFVKKYLLTVFVTDRFPAFQQRALTRHSHRDHYMQGITVG
jgi:hypothetical protein